MRIFSRTHNSACLTVSEDRKLVAPKSGRWPIGAALCRGPDVQGAKQRRGARADGPSDGSSQHCLPRGGHFLPVGFLVFWEQKGLRGESEDKSGVPQGAPTQVPCEEVGKSSPDHRLPSGQTNKHSETLRSTLKAPSLSDDSGALGWPHMPPPPHHIRLYSAPRLTTRRLRCRGRSFKCVRNPQHHPPPASSWRDEWRGSLTDTAGPLARAPDLVPWHCFTLSDETRLDEV